MYEFIIPQEFDQDDRIGKFTIPEAMIFGGGVVISAFLLALSFIPFWLSIPLSLIILGVTFYFIKKKINTIPMYEFIFVFMIYKSSPKLLIYKKENVKEDFIDEFYEEESKPKKKKRGKLK